MALTKAERAALREKFGGRCAYCGQPLGEKWHVDHIQHVERKMKLIPGRGFVSTGDMHRPERDTPENMNPACPPCNLDKHSMTLEDWRGMIERSNEVLHRDVSTFRRAVRYGLVALAPKPVVFHFESLQKDTPMTTPTNTAAASGAADLAQRIDANALEAMAKERPDDMFLKGSGILKLTQAIRQLEGENRILRAELDAPSAAPEAPADDATFEFWWADHMPNATQAEAWAEWCALRSNQPAPAAPALAGEYPADTGNQEADRIIGRLASSDPDFDDCAAAVALIHKLVAEHKGSAGFATWKDAAVAARLVAKAAPVVSATGHTDGGRNMFYEGLFDGESEREQKARLLWADAMRAAFERHTGNGWFDEDWRAENGTWAAAWRACIADRGDFDAGVEAAAAWVDRRMAAYQAEHGHVDPDTGTVEYGRSGAGEEYVGELVEIAEGLRAMAAARAQEGHSNG